MMVKPTGRRRAERKLMILTGIFLACILLAGAFLTSKDREVLLQLPTKLTVGDQKREYLHVKSRSEQPSKLVIGLHGFGDSSRKFAYYTALHNSVDDETIVIYPSAISPKQRGMKTGWNSGFCCGSGWANNTDDVAFIEKLIQKYSKKYGITPSNTFVVGFSNGAFMAQRFAAEKPEMIGGIVVVSGTIGTTTTVIQPQKPVHVLLMHGVKDKTIPFNGGATAGNPDFNWMPFSSTRAAWEKVNGDQATTKVVLYDEGQHAWSGWRITNFWQTRTIASDQAVLFIESTYK